MESNPVKHVVLALMLTAMLFIIAGDRWSERIGRFQPVRPANKSDTAP